jgi:hypothetical protein
MPKHFLQVKYLEHCEKGELVRAYFEENGQWAIAAHLPASTGSAKALVVLCGQKGPWLLSGQETATLHDAAQACLSYGTGFDILPVYDSGLSITGARGAAQNIPGTLALISPTASQPTTGRYLVVGSAARGVGPIRFLNLDSFEITSGGEPGGNRADFGEWAIWMTLPSQPVEPSSIFKFPSGSQATGAV